MNARIIDACDVEIHEVELPESVGSRQEAMDAINGSGNIPYVIAYVEDVISMEWHGCAADRE